MNCLSAATLDGIQLYDIFSILPNNKTLDARTNTRTHAYTFGDMVFDYKMKLILGTIFFLCISTYEIITFYERRHGATFRVLWRYLASAIL